MSAVPLFRRRRRRVQGETVPAATLDLQLHPPRPPRRGGGHPAVEFAGGARRMKTRVSMCGRQHPRPEDGGGCAAGPCCWLSTLALSTPAAGRAKPPHRLRFEEIGAALASASAWRKLSFTGSTGVGKHVVDAAGDRLAHRVSLELGGKSPGDRLPGCGDGWSAGRRRSSAAMRFTHRASPAPRDRGCSCMSVHDHFGPQLAAKLAQARSATHSMKPPTWASIINGSKQ